ncbi:MAG: DUF389 domain-containing protein [Epsilonproteobacteria bacterium]|nr:DUF389 domain-containing protein [Campylobacterota bacterium]
MTEPRADNTEIAAPIFLLYGADTPASTLETASRRLAETAKRPVCIQPVEQRHLYPSDALLFLLLDDAAFLEWIVSAPAVAGIVPLPWANNPLQRKHFCLPSGLQDAVEKALSPESATVNTLLYLGEEPVLGTVEIGKQLWREGVSTAVLLQRLFSLKMRAIKISTDKAHTFKTAAIQIEAGNEATLTCLRTRFFHPDENHCRRTAALIYAPQSLIGALRLRLFLANRAKPAANDTLPEGIGTIRSRAIEISSDDDKPLPVRFNNRKKSANHIRLESRDLPSPLFYGKRACTDKQDAKESIRTQNLPLDNDLIAFFTRRTLPLVPIASEEAFADLFTRLREAAGMPFYYIALLLISVLMASTGLFQNSSPTIIGAMILAPLMAPIIAFAMGAIRFDGLLLKKSAKTVLLSVAIALFSSGLLARLLPFAHVTEQMAARTHPTLLDLAVAILSGIAAAYGYANSRVGESLAGVAIAVALVPPLCVAGIGAGWGSWLIFNNAFLLFLANIAGIVVAAGATFYLLGYASQRYASAAFVVKLLMVALIAVPLWLSTRTLVEEERIYKAFEKVQTLSVASSRIALYLKAIVPKKDGMNAIIYATSPTPLTPDQKREIARRLHRALGKDVKLVLTFQELY